MRDKSVTYKTEILCSYWLSGRTGRKIIWLGVMIYGKYISQRRNPFFVCLGARVSHKKISYDAARSRREMF